MAQTPPVVALSFRLFRLTDKALRVLLYRHIVADLRAANRKRVAETTNRAVQGFLHSVLADSHEGCAKRAVALTAELYRRNVWTDARCVNLLGAACHHPSARVACSALRFFNGADEAHDEDDDGNGDGDSDGDAEGGDAVRRRRSAEAQGAVGLTKEQVYAAYSKGTAASKKRKQAALKREIARIKKRARKEEATSSGSGRFAALHLLHDPQSWSEKLLARLQHPGGSASSLGGWESKLLCLQVLTRCIGAHNLLIPNVYPFLQRYVAPHARDVTRLLAAAAQAVHNQVPPEWISPLVRTLVDNFCHDGARPEAMAVGLAAMREFALRQPLVMTPELLTDLAAYKKHKDKAVASAARGLIALFRELAPGLLEKRDRGRGGAMDVAAGRGLAPTAYGAARVASRVLGAELLEQHGAEDEEDVGSSGDDDEEEEEDGDDDASDGDEEEEEEEDVEEEASDDEVDELASDEEEGDEGEADEEGPSSKRHRVAPQADSIRSLKRAAAAAAAASGGSHPVLIEQERFLTDDDFKRIRALQADAAVHDAMHRFGAKKSAEEGATAVRSLMMQSDRRVDPDSLLGTHKVRADKAARLARVMEGREGREEFGASAKRHKKKSGGTSNKEKAKRKLLPLAARQLAAHRRVGNKKAHGKGSRKDKNFQGKKWR